MPGAEDNAATAQTPGAERSPGNVARQAQAAERRWRDLVEGSIQGVLVHRDHRVLFANDAAARMLGFADVAALEQAGPGIERVAPHDRPRVQGYFEARMAGRAAPSRYLFDAVRPDGSVAHLEAAVRVVDWDGARAVQCALVDLTERRRAEQALRESETRYRDLAEAGNDVYWETDAEHRFTHFSATRLPGVGATREQILDRTREELTLRPLDREQWQRYLAERAAHRPFRDVVYQIKPEYAEGRERWVRVSGTPRFDAAGRFLGYRGTAATVTDEIVARNRAGTAEARLAGALSGLSDGIALFDADGRLVSCNDTYRRIQGCDLDPLVRPGIDFESLLRHQVEQGHFLNARGQEEVWIRERLEAFWRGGEVFEVEREDGGWHLARDHRCPDGSIMVLCTDITELKSREARTLLSEQRLRDYATASSDWYWETDAQMRFTFLSRRFTELTGIDAIRFLGRRRSEVAPDGASPDAWCQHLADLAARRPFRGFTYFIERDDGDRRQFRISGVPVYAPDGSFCGYRGTGVDCTAEVEAQTAHSRYLEAIESFSDGYALFDADDRLVVWNSRWYEIAPEATRRIIRRGVRFEDIVRSNVASGRFPAAQDDRERWIAERMRRHRECSTPMEVELEPGRWFQLRDRRTPEGETLIIYSEITELKAREQALLESEERFRDFAETAADWLFETDRDLRFTFVSRRFETLTGIAEAQILGRPFEAIIAPGARARDDGRRCLAALRARETLVDVEFDGTVEGTQEVIHSVSARPLSDEEGRFRGYRGSGRDVTHARRLSVQLAWQATHDDLTGLVNRREFERRLAQVVESARGADVHHALCYVDLDQFKVVNDTCGHAAGDELLRQLGRTLKGQVRGRDTLARLGGDEFALLLEHCSLSQASAVADGLRGAIERYEFTWEGKRFHLGASIGLVPIDGRQGDETEALRAADSACYLAKDRGRNRVHVYAAGDAEIAQREGELDWVSRINRALAEDRFELYAQPIVASGPGPRQRARRFELLLRMVDDNESLSAPGAFLPAAERYGLATLVDRWVVTCALDTLRANAGAPGAGVSFSINLSGRSLGDREFHDFLVGQLEAHPDIARRLCFEVTETATIADLAGAKAFMEVIHTHGSRFALDDFGTGLSSYAYLRDLPVDYLKIDGAFVRDIEHDAVSLSVVRSINDIGHVLGKQTIAEYVSGPSHAQLLTDMGVDYLQGFGIGRPVPLAEVLRGTGPRPTEDAA